MNLPHKQRLTIDSNHFETEFVSWLDTNHGKFRGECSEQWRRSIANCLSKSKLLLFSRIESFTDISMCRHIFQSMLRIDMVEGLHCSQLASPAELISGVMTSVWKLGWKLRAWKARDLARGVQVMVPRNILRSGVSGMQFPAFWEKINRHLTEFWEL